MDNTVFGDINVVKGIVPYSKVIGYIDFVVKNSFGKDGRYHEYLKDYATAVAILTLYTDCEAENFAFDDIMEFIGSDRWYEIINELDEKYDEFTGYVDSEIEYINTPFRFADDTLKSANKALTMANTIMGAIDVEALKEFDFGKIIEAVDRVKDAESGAKDAGASVDTEGKVKKTTKKGNLTVVK